MKILITILTISVCLILQLSRPDRTIDITKDICRLTEKYLIMYVNELVPVRFYPYWNTLGVMTGKSFGTIDIFEIENTTCQS